MIYKNPELEKQIMFIVTKGITEEEAAKGKAIAQYALSTALDDFVLDILH